MFISRVNKFLFLRVPKTGSSTAKSALRNAYINFIEQGQSVPHEKLTEILDTYPRMEETLTDDFRIIGFVREPVDWINSMFGMMRTKHTWSIKWMGMTVDGLDKKRLPSAFIEAIPTPYDWFTDHDGVCRVNEIWRTEDMTKFCADLALPPLWENRTTNKDRRTLAFTTDDLGAIQRKFHRELKHYPGWPDWKRG